MPPATAYCRKCREKHSRPVGRNCQRVEVGDATAIEASVSEPSQTLLNAPVAPIAPTQAAVNLDILEKLSMISGQISSLDGRVRQTEATLADRTTDSVNPASASSTATANPIAINATASNASNNVTGLVNDALSVAPVSFSGNNGNLVPTTDFLRSNIDIQRQVDVRFAELHNAQVATSSSGKLKSQRGGASDVPIKKFVAF